MLNCSLQLNLNQAGANSALGAIFDWSGDGILGLQGPSGSGKTTFLKQLAGFGQTVKTTQHWIKWGQQVWESEQLKIKPHKRPVTLVFQQHPLFPHLIVSENLDFARQHSYRDISDELFQQIISEFKINELLPKSSLHLSGGQQSRIALVQGLLARPELLLLDEPFAALDEDTQLLTAKALKRFSKQLSIAIILVSHSPHQLASLCDQLMTIENHQITAPTQEVLNRLNHPKNSAKSSANINTFLNATLKSFHQESHLACFDVNGSEWFVASKHQPEQQVVIAIPASEVSLTLEQPAATSIANCIPVVVDSWSDTSNGCLVKLKYKQILISCKITQYSFQKLNLDANLSLFAQFKATNIAII